MEICHPWHAHPLFLSDEAKFVEHCLICAKGLEGNPFYACADCKYYVHGSCAQLPATIQHPFHPSHPLDLDFGSSFSCDSCHKGFKEELRFRCSTCNVDLDLKCATMPDIDTEGKESIKHFTHQHPLTLCSGDDDKALTCFACKKTSSDSIYGCTPCDYFLHQSCSEMPTHVLHAMHPQHPLSVAVRYGSCNYCKHYGHTWRYCCALCDFNLDGSCFIQSAKYSLNLERPCFLCGKQHLDSDSCVESLYVISQSCIQLPEKIKHEFHPHNPFLLLGAKDFECGSCHKYFDGQPRYGCEDCNFGMDIKCALMPSIQNVDSDESICQVIPHHFSHQHPLHLIGEVYDINCSVCHGSKASPIYGCIRCEYFLHQSCLELPFQIEHPFHASHVLTLQPLRGNFCQICRRKYNGFAFGCIECLFFVGIECIFEPAPVATLDHKYHPHLLYLIEKPCCALCDADGTFCRFSEESSEFKFTKSYSLRCLDCDFNLHFLCGPLPCTIKHKSHLHALTLEDSAVEDDSDEHYCDVCEEIRNPRLCVYYCKDCQFFAHVHCVISEIINLLKNSEKVKLRIVGDWRLEETINAERNNVTKGILLDLLKRLDERDLSWLGYYFRGRKIFLREEDPWDMLGSSFEDARRNVIEELSFYNDDIVSNIEKRLESFKPCAKCHIEDDECALPLIEIEGFKVTSNFVSLSRALLTKYGDFHKYSRFSENVKSVVLYFLCRVLTSMHKTFVVDITEKQLFTWHYYIRGISDFDFDVDFCEPFLGKITRSYFGLQAMKFESEACEKMDQEISNLEQKMADIKTQIEELKQLRQQHKPGKIAAESTVMREFFTAAKELKWQKASEGII